MILNNKALLRATIGVIWLIVIMTLAAELSAPFKLFLTNLTSHHWISKSIISAAAFVIFYLLFRKSDDSEGALKNTVFVVGGVILGGIIIFSFYLWHFIQG